jgi:hypothetical protein
MTRFGVAEAESIVDGGVECSDDDLEVDACPLTGTT